MIRRRSSLSASQQVNKRSNIQQIDKSAVVDIGQQGGADLGVKGRDLFVNAFARAHVATGAALLLGQCVQQNRKLAPVRAAIVASPWYLERAGTPRDPEDLREHNCLSYRSPPEVWNFTRGRTVPVRGNLNFDNGDALRQSALAGLGIVYLPTFLIGEDVREGRLVHLLADDVDAEAGIYAVYPSCRHLSPKVRALIDYLVEQLGPEPDWDRFDAVSAS